MPDSFPLAIYFKLTIYRKKQLFERIECTQRLCFGGRTLKSAIYMPEPWSMNKTLDPLIILIMLIPCIYLYKLFPFCFLLVGFHLHYPNKLGAKWLCYCCVLLINNMLSSGIQKCNWLKKKDSFIQMVKSSSFTGSFSQLIWNLEIYNQLKIYLSSTPFLHKGKF